MFSFKDYDAVVITDEKQIFYLTGFFAEDATVVITEEEKLLLTDMRYFHAAEKHFYGGDYKAVLGGTEFLKEYVEKKKIKRIGVDYSSTTLKQSAALRKCCSSLTDVSAFLEESELVKSEKELAKISKACRITEEAFAEVLPYIKEGVSERELQAEIIYRFLKKGAEKPSFEPIVAFGENSAIPHHKTGETKLKKGQAVLFDIGCVYSGYCSDFTRTVFYGKPTAEFYSAYNSVYDAFFNAYHNITAGTTCFEADKLARDILEKDNLPFTHSLGHGVGINIHERPYLSKKSKEVLKNGNVFTIEPGCYLTGKFGIRLEDTVYLKDGKVNDFYSFDKKLKIIE